MPEKPEQQHDAGERPLDDMKAKMRAALDRKKGNDTGVSTGGHKREKGHETHGPLGGVHVHRRKAGGGGS